MNVNSYNCVTSHWFNGETYELETRLVDVSQFVKQHTGENLCEELEIIFMKYGITREKLVLAATDKGSNIGGYAMLSCVTAP